MKKIAVMLLVVISLVAFVSCETDPWENVEEPSADMYNWLLSAESSVTKAFSANRDSFVCEENQSPEGYDVQVNTMNVDTIDYNGRAFSSIVMTVTAKPEHVQEFEYEAEFTDDDGMEYDFWFCREIDGKTGESHLWALVNGKVYESSWTDVEKPSDDLFNWLERTHDALLRIRDNNSSSFVYENKQSPDGWGELVHTMNVDRLEDEGRVFSSIVMKTIKESRLVEAYEYDAKFTDTDGTKYDLWCRHDYDYKTGDNQLQANVDGNIYVHSGNTRI